MKANVTLHPFSRSAVTAERNALLLVDDDLEYAVLLGEWLAESGIVMDHAESWAAMERRLHDRSYALVVLDARLPDADAIERLPDLIGRLPQTPVLIATTIHDVAMSVEAMRRGASTYFTKWLDCERIVDEILRMLPAAAVGADRDFQAARAAAEEWGLVGEHPRFLRAIEDASCFAEVDSTLLLVGEAGSGKDRFARAIHQRSRRRAGPFVAVRCGTTPADRLDKDLFGENGDGGFFHAARGGTLFLDAIGDVPLPTQAKLLDFLRPAPSCDPVDAMALARTVRVLASTDRPLEKQIRQGTFRQELYFRLSALRLDVPALRDRASDVPLLVKDAVDRSNARLGRDVAYPSSDVMARLSAQRWPGNVRELQNTLERAVALATDGRIELRHLATRDERGADSVGTTFAEAKRAFEMEYLMEVLRDCGGNLAEAARRAGLHRPQLYRLLSRHGLGRSVERE